MPVFNNFGAMNAADRLALRIRHFARGSWPEAIGRPLSFPINHFFLPIRNPNGDECYLEDAKLHYTLRPGCAYFIPPFHTSRMRLDREFTFLSIHFSLELFGGVDLFSHFQTILEIPDNSYWLRRAEKAHSEPNNYISAALVRGLTEEFSALLLGKMDADKLKQATCFAGFQKVLEYIRLHCSAAMTIEEIAALRKERREVFSRNFTMAIGISPKQFLSRCLTNRACDLLLGSHLLVREIAFELGFSNEYYFSRFFRKQTGLPPRRFRLYHLEEQELHPNERV